MHRQAHARTQAYKNMFPSFRLEPETQVRLTAPPFCLHISRIENPRSLPTGEHPAGQTVPRPSVTMSFIQQRTCMLYRVVIQRYS